MNAIADEPQRLNLLLITNDIDREMALLEALQESRTRCRLLSIPRGKDTIRYLERKGRFERAPKHDLVFFDPHQAGAEAMNLLRKIKKRQSLNTLPVVVLVDDETRPLLENVPSGSARSPGFAPVDLKDFLASMNNAPPARFLRAVCLLEQYGYILVRQTVNERSEEPPLVESGRFMQAAGADAS